MGVAALATGQSVEPVHLGGADVFVASEPGHCVRTLIINDSEADIRRIRMLLAAIDGTTFNVETALSIDDAQSAIESDAYDLFIVDFWMGTQTSLDLVEAIVARNPTVPILILSALDAAAIDNMNMPEGSVHFVSRAKLTADTLSGAIARTVAAAPTLSVTPSEFGAGPALICWLLDLADELHNLETAARMAPDEADKSDAAARSRLRTACDQASALRHRVIRHVARIDRSTGNGSGNSVAIGGLIDAQLADISHCYRFDKPEIDVAIAVDPEGLRTALALTLEAHAEWAPVSAHSIQIRISGTELLLVFGSAGGETEFGGRSVTLSDAAAQPRLARLALAAQAFAALGGRLAISESASETVVCALPLTVHVA